MTLCGLRLSFFLLKLCVGCYALLQFRNSYLQASLACIKQPSQCSVGEAKAKRWQQFWMASMMLSAMMIVVQGCARQASASVVLLAWLAFLGTVGLDAPHFSFVSLAIAYVASMHAERDHAALCSGKQEDPNMQHNSYNHDRGFGHAVSNVVPSVLPRVMRATLSVSYFFSGFAKLSTPAWRHGAAIALLTQEDSMRSWVRVSGFADIVSAGSVPISAAAILVECGLPILELVLLRWCCISPVLQNCHPPTALVMLSCAYAASAAMHLGIWILLPLSDVSVGMLIFHFAVLDALVCDALACNARLQVVGGEERDHLAEQSQGGDGIELGDEEGSSGDKDHEVAPESGRPQDQRGVAIAHGNNSGDQMRALSLRSMSGALLALAILLALSLRPLSCVLSDDGWLSGLGDDVNHPLLAALVKGFTPMPNTGYEQWRCDGRGDPFALPAREDWASDIVLRFVDDQGVKYNRTRGQIGPVKEALSGGHVWHLRMERMFLEATLTTASKTGASAREGAALIVCSCSPLHEELLVSQIWSDVMAVEQTRRITRFKVGDGPWVVCARHSFCKVCDSELESLRARFHMLAHAPRRQNTSATAIHDHRRMLRSNESSGVLKDLLSMRPCRRRRVL